MKAKVICKCKSQHWKKELCLSAIIPNEIMNTSIGKNLFTSFIDLIGKYTNWFSNNRNLINELIFAKRIHTTGFFFFLFDQKESKKSRLMIN
jgi:hypothetical protein